MQKNSSHHVIIEGLKIHYQECGEGEPVLMLHGWPTSSFLWRNILPVIGETHRAIAIDLPGFGASDKPLDMPFYSYRFYERILDAFLEALNIKEVHLAVHDLGGPVGLSWFRLNMERVQTLILLNTLIYPIPSFMAGAFLAACWVPGVSTWLTSKAGLELAFKMGMNRQDLLTEEVLAGVQEPFSSPASRKALLKTIKGIHPQGLYKISQQLPFYKGPVQIIYGKQDKILPDVAKTMTRVARELPQAEINILDDCGHFLQEDNPDLVAKLMSAFLNASMVSS